MSRCALLLALILGACAEEPLVEVLTRDGQAVDPALLESMELWLARLRGLGERSLDAAVADIPADDAEPPRRRARLPRANALDEAPDGQVPTARSEEAAPSDPAFAAPHTPEALAELVEQLREGAHRDVPALARALAAAPAPLWPELRRLLLAPRKARKADYKALLALIGGDVPGRYGHFELAWKRAHGHKVRLSEDWFEDLLTLPSRQVSRALRPIYRDCVIEAALLRASEAAGRDPARADDVVDALLAAAYVHEGTFRDEVGRAIRRLGDDAVPALIRGAIRPPLPDDEKAAQELKDSQAYRQAEYAAYQIDRMDRAHPRKALAASHDEPRRLVALLEAYAIARPGEAAAPILEQIDAALPRVRAAARAAFLAYVSGPAPRAERKIVRMLGGATGESSAQPTYRDLARVALTSRLAESHPELLSAACPRERGKPLEACDAPLDQLARELFARLDAARAEREHRLIAAALAEDDKDAAIATLDALLADHPDLSARAELVPPYEAAAAAAVAAGDLARGARLYRKSAALLRESDPALSDALRGRALLAEAELAGTDAGRQMLLESAARISASDPAVAPEEMARSPAGDATRRRMAFGTAVTVGALTLIFALAGLLRGRLRP